jgi:hypothetical protein
VLSFGGLLFCFFFGEAKKKRSPLQATERIVYAAFNEKINSCIKDCILSKDIFKILIQSPASGFCLNLDLHD